MAALVRFALALAALIALAFPATAAEEIRSYDIDVVVGTDGALTVTETIAVNVEGKEIRRGIFRSIPKTMIGDDALIRQPKIEILSVLRNGEPETYRVDATNTGIDVRIGKEDVFIEHAVHTYTLSYTMTGMVIPDRDTNALAWEPIGSGWPFPILSASIKITVPDEAEITYTNARVGTASGSKAGPWEQPSPQSATFRATTLPDRLKSLSITLTFTGGIERIGKPGRA